MGINKQDKIFASLYIHIHLKGGRNLSPSLSLSLSHTHTHRHTHPHPHPHNVIILHLRLQIKDVEGGAQLIERVFVTHQNIEEALGGIYDIQ